MLRKQTLRADKVIVVDSSSADGTPSLARDLGCDVTEIPRASFSHGGTRNLAASRSDADLLVFMTQDALPASETFLERLVEPLTAPSSDLAATFARQIPYPDAAPTEQFARMYNYPSGGFIRTKAEIAELGIRAFFFSNVSSAIRRDVFERVGRFPAETIANEDMLLCAKILRAGGSVRYAPEAVVFHSHNYSVSQQFHRFFDIGVALKRAEALLQGGAVGGEGLRYLAAQTRYLASCGAWQSIPRSAAESAAKLCALELGKRERFLPVALKKRLSMHSLFWLNNPSRLAPEA